MWSVQRCRDFAPTVAVNAVSALPRTFFYGGQAVVEVVLMRVRDRYAVAARKRNADIVLCTDVLRSRAYSRTARGRTILGGGAGLGARTWAGAPWSGATGMGRVAGFSGWKRATASCVATVLGWKVEPIAP